VNAIQTNMSAVAAHIYPTKVRATGVASAFGVGRAGSILSALAGAGLVQAGKSVYYGVLAVGMAGVFLGLSLVRNHIPAHRRSRTQ
jgi:AAHS family 4-hydroxybenzoate transporter-like MFS transporter